MKAKISQSDIELLSAYLDRQLDSGKRVRLESRLRTEPLLRDTYNDLRRTRALIRSLPRLKAPRNFTLTSRMVGEVPATKTPPRRIYPIFQFTSAIASILLLVVLLGDFLGLGVSPSAPRLAGAQNGSEVAIQEAPSVQTDRSLEATETAQPPASGMLKIEGSNTTPEALNNQPQALTVPAPASTAVISPTTPLTSSIPPVETIPPGQHATRPEETNPPNRTIWRFAEIILVLVALASGLAAVYLRRRL